MCNSIMESQVVQAIRCRVAHKSALRNKRAKVSNLAQAVTVSFGRGQVLRKEATKDIPITSSNFKAREPVL